MSEFVASRMKGVAEASASFESEAPSDVEFEEVAFAAAEDMTREARRCFAEDPTSYKRANEALITEIPTAKLISAFLPFP